MSTSPDAPAHPKTGAPFTTIPGRCPGELVLEHALVERVVADLGRIRTRTGLEEACAIGRCLLGHFFEGSVDVFREKKGRHISFRKLSERTDLPYSCGKLYASVMVTEQLTQLPEKLGWALPFTHHRALLKIKDPELKLVLAQLAVKRKLSSRAFLDEVDAHVQPLAGARRGRPPMPPVVKQLRKAAKVLGTEALEQADHRALLDNFSPDELADILSRAEAYLELVRAALQQQRCAEWEIEDAQDTAEA